MRCHCRCAKLARPVVLRKMASASFAARLGKTARCPIWDDIGAKVLHDQNRIRILERREMSEKEDDDASESGAVMRFPVPRTAPCDFATGQGDVSSFEHDRAAS